MSAMASQITSLTIVYTTVYSRKTSKLCVTDFGRGIHWWPVNYLHKGPVTRKIVPLDDVINKDMLLRTYPIHLIILLQPGLIICADSRRQALCPEYQFNTLRARQSGRHIPDDILKCIFLNKNVWILIKISLKFVPKGRMNNIPVLGQITAWRRPGDKQLSEPKMVSLPTHIWVTRPQWVKLTVCRL